MSHMTFDWSQFDPPAVVVPGFVPHFREGQRIFDLNSGKSYPLNDDYFATLETAQYIATKFGDGKVYEAPFEGEGGPMVCTAKCYVTKIPSGRGVNCGFLAAYYKRNPEAQFPGLAAKLILLDLAKG